jgi:hypothetical protein
MFGFGRRDIADKLKESAVVKPVDPFQRDVLDSFERPPWSSPVDDFGLEKAIDRLDQSVVIAVANTPDRWFDPGFGEALAIFRGG